MSVTVGFQSHGATDGLASGVARRRVRRSRGHRRERGRRAPRSPQPLAILWLDQAASRPTGLCPPPPSRTSRSNGPCSTSSLQSPCSTRTCVWPANSSVAAEARPWSSSMLTRDVVGSVASTIHASPTTQPVSVSPIRPPRQPRARTDSSWPCSGAQEWSKPRLAARATAEFTSGGGPPMSEYAVFRRPPCCTNYWVVRSSTGSRIRLRDPRSQRQGRASRPDSGMSGSVAD